MARILFVDDDDLTLQLMEKMTHLLGHEALLTASADEALVCVQEEHPDAILVDMRLRETNGLDLIEHLRSDMPDMHAVPMYVVSAGSSRDEEDALQAGASGFIRKPISLDQLSSIANLPTNGNGRNH